jgi:hypothetical protein
MKQRKRNGQRKLAASTLVNQGTSNTELSKAQAAMRFVMKGGGQ